MCQRVNFCTWLSMLCFAVLLLLPSAAFAEVQTVEADGYYTVGDGAEENFSVARERAKQDAMGRAAEQAAVYVEKYTAVKNHQLTDSEVRTLAAKVLSVESATFENTTEGNVFKIRCHVVARVKEEEALASLLSDKQQLKESLEREQEKDKKIAELNRQMEELNRQFQAAKTDSERAEIRQQAKANDASFSAMQWVEQAYRAYDDEDYMKAIACCNMAIDLNSQLDQAYRILGRTHFQLQNYGKAIENLRKVLAIVPDDYRAAFPYAFLGDVYYEIGDYKQAIVCYSKTLERDPHLHTSYTDAGNVYKKLTNACFSAGEGHEKAIEAYNRALDKKIMSMVFVYNDLGNIYNEMGDYNKAIEYYNKVITKYPEYETTYYNLGNTYRDQGDYRKAIEYYNKAIEVSKGYCQEAYNDRGGCYEKLGHREEAKRDYAKAYELEPDNETYRENRRRSENW